MQKTACKLVHEKCAKNQFLKVLFKKINGLSLQLESIPQTSESVFFSISIFSISYFIFQTVGFLFLGLG